MEKQVQNDIENLFGPRHRDIIERYTQLRKYDKIINIISLKRSSLVSNINQSKKYGNKMDIKRTKLYTEMFRSLNRTKDHFEELSKK